MHPCCNCCTTEGESELSTSRNIGLAQAHILLLYTAAMMQDLTSGPVLYMDGPALNQYGGSTVTIKTPSKMKLQTAHIIFAQ